MYLSKEDIKGKGFIVDISNEDNAFEISTIKPFPFMIFPMKTMHLQNSQMSFFQESPGRKKLELSLTAKVWNNALTYLQKLKMTL
jgi:hypothetical protein